MYKFGTKSLLKSDGVVQEDLNEWYSLVTMFVVGLSIFWLSFFATPSLHIPRSKIGSSLSTPPTTETQTQRHRRFLLTFVAFAIDSSLILRHAFPELTQVTVIPDYIISAIFLSGLGYYTFKLIRWCFNRQSNHTSNAITSVLYPLVAILTVKSLFDWEILAVDFVRTVSRYQWDTVYDLISFSTTFIVLLKYFKAQWKPLIGPWSFLRLVSVGLSIGGGTSMVYIHGKTGIPVILNVAAELAVVMRKHWIQLLPMAKVLVLAVGVVVLNKLIRSLARGLVSVGKQIRSFRRQIRRRKYLKITYLQRYAIGVIALLVFHKLCEYPSFTKLQMTYQILSFVNTNDSTDKLKFINNFQQIHDPTLGLILDFCLIAIPLSIVMVAFKPHPNPEKLKYKLSQPDLGDVSILTTTSHFDTTVETPLLQHAKTLSPSSTFCRSPSSIKRAILLERLDSIRKPPLISTPASTRSNRYTSPLRYPTSMSNESRLRLSSSRIPVANNVRES
ncbi:hypothetical protein BKA69DRAFT_1039042 [Paraphysoderma sedebokerense]|nr:hypothetical protein BKA69DRAFT_1039042 [Paraphysoderma sedebokerense]